MVLCCFGKEAVLAGLAAKAQAPVVVTDKAKLSPTVGTAIFRLGHGALSSIRGSTAPRPAIGTTTNVALRAQPHQDRALAQQPGIAFRLVDRERGIAARFRLD